MKIVCTNCQKEEELDDKSFKDLSYMVKEYGMEISGYLSILNNMFGKCLNDSEHSFTFDKTFTDQIQDVVNKEKSNIIEHDKVKKNIEISNQENKTLQEKINELTLKSNELKMKIDHDKEMITYLNEERNNLKIEIEKLTGNSNITIWY